VFTSAAPLADPNGANNAFSLFYRPHDTPSPSFNSGLDNVSTPVGAQRRGLLGILDKPGILGKVSTNLSTAFRT